MIFGGSGLVSFDRNPDSGSNPIFYTDPDPRIRYGFHRSGSATLPLRKKGGRGSMDEMGATALFLTG